MGVMWSFVRRSLAANKTRTAVTIIGVILSTALLMAVFTTITSLQGTIQSTVAESEGTWHAFDSDAEDEWQIAVMAEDHITAALRSGDHCMSYLDTAESADENGTPYEIFAVRTLPQVVKGTDEDAYALCEQPTLVEGRLPENENELMVPASLVGLHAGDKEDAARWDGALAIGSTIELTASERLTPSGRSISSYYFLSDYFNEADYEAQAGGDYEETLSGYEERTFTVVGVFEDQPSKIFEAGGSDVCLVAFTSANAGFTKEAVWLSTEGFLTRDEFCATLDEIFGENDYYVHNSLLNYIGLTSSSDIWNTLWTIAGVLAATIMIAAVSLIYNSFAISVAERTRQFGLLSSLGASRRQLGWSILLEALTIGAVGIPLGILLGIAGVAVTLSISGQALSDLLGAYASVAVTVHVSPLATAIAVVLSLITLLISALVPALRAGRVSATDAIRQTQDVHLDRATERKLKRAGEQGKLMLGTSSIREWLGGIGGLLAHRNLRRSGSKGRVVVTSLAVSVLLLVTSGAIAQALNRITDRYETTYGAGSSDVVVSLYGSGTEEVDYRQAAEELAGKLTQVDGLTHALTVIYGSSDATLSAGMCSDEMIDSGFYHGEIGLKDGIYVDGSYIGWANIMLVDDATWSDMLALSGAGQDGTGDGPRVIAINRIATYDDNGRYYELTPFDETGPVTFFSIDRSEPIFEDEAPNSYTTLFKDTSGTVVMGLLTYGADGEELIDSKPLSDIPHTETTLDVVALLDEVPADLANGSTLGSFPLLVMPLSGYDAISDYVSGGGVNLAYNFEEGADMEAVGIAIDEALAQPPEGTWCTWNNMKENLEITRRLFDMVYLFVFLFSVITMLIAVANVFNTLSNNIILRTREFAVLKSCGMDNRAFGRMLLSECASYAVRGLVIGLGLATLAAWIIWKGMSESFVEQPFELPWTYVGAAVAGVVVVLAISVVYALRRSHALNVVEALRADAI